MRSFVFALLLALQDPIRMPPPPQDSVPEARETLLGYRLVDVRADGAYVLGSACPTAPFLAYTAHHVIKEVKGELLALPTHGRAANEQTASHVHVTWTDEKHDLAIIVPDSGPQAFLHWYRKGVVPLVGAEVRGTLILPEGQQPAAPSFGTYYGETDGLHWSSLMLGPGSSGSCVLDAQDRAWGVVTSLAAWGTGDALAHASVIRKLPEKDP